MTGIKTRVLSWLKNSKVRWGLLSGAWVLVVITLIAPLWQGVMFRSDEIKDLETRLATMDDWTVAGMWLAPSVSQRTLPVNAAFRRLFPSERMRENLFLSLARVADQSGVEEFNLVEANTSGMYGNDVWMDGTSMAATPEAAPPPTGATAEAMDAGVALEIPKVELTSYRVKASFSGDYQRIAHFMNGLKHIERALKVHSLVVRPEKDCIQVNLELDVYVSKTSQS